MATPTPNAAYAYTQANTNAPTNAAISSAGYIMAMQELKNLARHMEQTGFGFYAGEVNRIRKDLAQGTQAQGGAL